MNHLLVLRHGETDGNRHRIVQRPETPLNEAGRRQADNAAARLAEHYKGRLVIRSSDYRRAAETATAVAAACGTDVVHDSLLRERNLGDLRGRRYDELGLDPFAPGYHPPGGESWEQFFERVACAEGALAGHLAELDSQRSLLLVTHGLVCRALAANHWSHGRVVDPNSLLPEDPLTANWPNTSLTIFDLASNPKTVLTFNCDLHNVGEGTRPKGPAPGDPAIA